MNTPADTESQKTDKFEIFEDDLDNSCDEGFSNKASGIPYSVIWGARCEVEKQKNSFYITGKFGIATHPMNHITLEKERKRRCDEGGCNRCSDFYTFDLSAVLKGATLTTFPYVARNMIRCSLYHHIHSMSSESPVPKQIFSIGNSLGEYRIRDWQLYYLLGTMLYYGAELVEGEINDHIHATCLIFYPETCMFVAEYPVHFMKRPEFRELFLNRLNDDHMPWFHDVKASASFNNQCFSYTDNVICSYNISDSKPTTYLGLMCAKVAEHGKQTEFDLSIWYRSGAKHKEDTEFNYSGFIDYSDGDQVFQSHRVYESVLKTSLHFGALWSDIAKTMITLYKKDEEIDFYSVLDECEYSLVEFRRAMKHEYPKASVIQTDKFIYEYLGMDAMMKLAQTIKVLIRKIDESKFQNVFYRLEAQASLTSMTLGKRKLKTYIRDFKLMVDTMKESNLYKQLLRYFKRVFGVTSNSTQQILYLVGFGGAGKTYLADAMIKSLSNFSGIEHSKLLSHKLGRVPDASIRQLFVCDEQLHTGCIADNFHNIQAAYTSIYQFDTCEKPAVNMFIVSSANVAVHDYETLKEYHVENCMITTKERKELSKNQRLMLLKLDDIVWQAQRRITWLYLDDQNRDMITKMIKLSKIAEIICSTAELPRKMRLAVMQHHWNYFFKVCLEEVRESLLNCHVDLGSDVSMNEEIWGDMIETMYVTSNNVYIILGKHESLLRKRTPVKTFKEDL